MGALIACARRWLAGMAAGLMLPALSFAQTATEPAVKAAFLLKFAGYVEWPAAYFATPEAPVVIAVSSSEDVANALDGFVPGRHVNGRAVVVKRLREGEVPQAVHIVFVGRGERNARATIRAAQQQGALVVTDAERGLELGAAVAFVRAEDRIGFEVSLESAERSGLRISSRMLGVARRVVPR